jgi:hypothetical protein
MIMTIVLLSALSLLTATVPQGPDLTGRWDVRVEAARQSMPDGGSRSRRALTLVLEIETTGSRATARFDTPPSGAVALTGTWTEGRLDLASEWTEMEVTRNGKPDKAKARWVIRGSLKDGVLGGTWDAQLGDSSLPQRWQARRHGSTIELTR